MIDFKNGNEESRVLTICKDGKDFKFEVETPQDFLSQLLGNKSAELD